MAATTRAMTASTGRAGAIVAAGCEACEHPGRGELDQQLMHEVATEVVAQSFGISQVVVEWHASRHLRGVARPVPTDARELLVDLDYARTQAQAVAATAAAAGKYAVQVSAIKEYREATQAIAKLVDARSVLAQKQPDARLNDLLDAFLKLFQKHPDWRDEIVAAIEAADKKGARSS